MMEQETANIFKISVGKIDRDEEVTVKIQYIDKKKKYYIDNSEIKKSTDFLSNLNVIIFYPDDLSLIKGSPSERRRFLNSEISQLYGEYLTVVNDYNKLLKMRND